MAFRAIPFTREENPSAANYCYLENEESAEKVLHSSALGHPFTDVSFEAVRGEDLGLPLLSSFIRGSSHVVSSSCSRTSSSQREDSPLSSSFCRGPTSLHGVPSSSQRKYVFRTLFLSDEDAVGEEDDGRRQTAGTEPHRRISLAEDMTQSPHSNQHTGVGHHWPAKGRASSSVEGLENPPCRSSSPLPVPPPFSSPYRNVCEHLTHEGNLRHSDGHPQPYPLPTPPTHEPHLRLQHKNVFYDANASHSCITLRESPKGSALRVSTVEQMSGSRPPDRPLPYRSTVMGRSGGAMTASCEGPPSTMPSPSRSPYSVKRRRGLTNILHSVHSSSTSPLPGTAREGPSRLLSTGRSSHPTNRMGPPPHRSSSMVSASTNGTPSRLLHLPSSRGEKEQRGEARPRGNPSTVRGSIVPPHQEWQVGSAGQPLPSQDRDRPTVPLVLYMDVSTAKPIKRDEKTAPVAPNREAPRGMPASRTTANTTLPPPVPSRPIALPGSSLAWSPGTRDRLRHSAWVQDQKETTTPPPPVLGRASPSQERSPYPLRHAGARHSEGKVEKKVEAKQQKTTRSARVASQSKKRSKTKENTRETHQAKKEVKKKEKEGHGSSLARGDSHGRASQCFSRTASEPNKPKKKEGKERKVEGKVKKKKKEEEEERRDATTLLDIYSTFIPTDRTVDRHRRPACPAAATTAGRMHERQGKKDQGREGNTREKAHEKVEGRKEQEALKYRKGSHDPSLHLRHQERHHSPNASLSSHRTSKDPLSRLYSENTINVDRGDQSHTSKTNTLSSYRRSSRERTTSRRKGEGTSSLRPVTDGFPVLHPRNRTPLKKGNEGHRRVLKPNTATARTSPAFLAPSRTAHTSTLRTSSARETLRNPWDLCRKGTTDAILHEKDAPLTIYCRNTSSGRSPAAVYRGSSFTREPTPTPPVTMGWKGQGPSLASTISSARGGCMRSRSRTDKGRAAQEWSRRMPGPTTNPIAERFTSHRGIAPGRVTHA